MLHLGENIVVTRRQIRGILNDSGKSAAAVNLTYVTDTQPGITRVKKRAKFVYLYNDRVVREKSVLERIKKLVIPPAWEKVWICRSADGHLQATGIDIKNRKQYKYHHLWSTLRNHTKFYRLYEFGKTIPAVRKRIEKDLSARGLPLNKVLAAVVCLMERTSIRVGNNLYERLYGSFGLTTLKDHHVKINGSVMQFYFRGKKGVTHRVTLRNMRLAKIVRQCREIPGKELFQYIDENGERKCIDSGMVNAYIRSISGCDFTAKDFRTWTGTVQAIAAFKELGYSETITGTNKNIISALNFVARHLGNTRTVCKKYYVHPLIIELYESKRLLKYLDGAEASAKPEGTDLSREEKALLKILQKESSRLRQVA